MRIGADAGTNTGFPVTAFVIRLVTPQHIRGRQAGRLNAKVSELEAGGVAGSGFIACVRCEFCYHETMLGTNHVRPGRWWDSSRGLIWVVDFLA